MSDPQLDNIFGSISRSKPINNFAARLGAGNHRVAIKKFGLKQSQKTGNILEADFLVLKSTTIPRGESRGWAWFINAKGEFAAQYEEARAKEFLVAVQKCIGDTSDVSSIGSQLASAPQPGRGIVLDVQITLQTNRDGSPKCNAKGEQYTNATWMAVPQELSALAQMRTKLDMVDAGQTIDAVEGTTPQAPPVAQPATQAPAATAQQFAPPAQPAAEPAPSSGFGALLANLRAPK